MLALKRSASGPGIQFFIRLSRGFIAGATTPMMYDVILRQAKFSPHFFPQPIMFAAIRRQLRKIVAQQVPAEIPVTSPPTRTRKTW
jgi:hypothetical protein